MTRTRERKIVSIDRDVYQPNYRFMQHDILENCQHIAEGGYYTIKEAARVAQEKYGYTHYTVDGIRIHKIAQ